MLQSLEENISSNNILQHPDNGCTLYKKGHPQNTLRTETEYYEIKQNINMPTGPLRNPLTCYKITHARTQVAQRDFQAKATWTSPP